MGILNVYLITVLFSFIPYMTERTLTQFKLNKDGYRYNNYSALDDLKIICENFFASLIPIFNILKGIKGIVRLINFKKAYADNKMRMLVNKQIYNPKDKTENDEIRDMLLTFGEIIGVTEEERSLLQKAVDILEMYEFAIEHGYQVDPNFKEMSDYEKYNYLNEMVGEALKLYEQIFYSGYKIDSEFNNMSDGEKLEYLRKVSNEINIEKNKAKPYDKMNTKEKLSYLRREKEDVIREQDSNKHNLGRRKNGKK